MSETHQERVKRLITERDAAINRLAEWFVRSSGKHFRSPCFASHPFCKPYSLHNILDKAISDVQKKRNGNDDDQH